MEKNTALEYRRPGFIPHESVSLLWGIKQVIQHLGALVTPICGLLICSRSL